MKRRSVVVHGHYYQPPREDPWTDVVPIQPSAAPHHDWNERVHDECYRAVVAARVLDGGGRIERVVNTLEWTSWDAGPTLLEWLARERPDTYRRFLLADRASRERTGHGNALATPYHHVILPLASLRDKITEVRWGISDFRRRFGREPEGMWLPETAVDTETLEILAQEGIRFTVVAPRQVLSAPQGGLPGRVPLSGGRSIALFVYDGAQSHDVAFGGLLRDSDAWVARLDGTSDTTELISIATDGETFGHHHAFGEMALAAMLLKVGQRPEYRLESFASFLARHPPVEDVELVEPSSWSCAHGVERWRGPCGCKIDPDAPTSQEWRIVLREALDELRSSLDERYEVEAGTLLRDPWLARDEYGGLLDASDAAREEFVERHATGAPDAAQKARALELLETQRDALRMYTSCAWFFDDVARLEPLQNLRYAAHALDLLGDGAEALEDRLVRRLAHAASNDPEEGDASRLWRKKVREGAGPDRAARSVGVAPATRALLRALLDPAEGTVGAALASLEGADEREVFAAQTELATELARRGGVGRHLGALADRLGVATTVPPEGLPAGGPLRFVFGVHLHQPVGNYDEVFRRHVEDVYTPFLERAAERDFLPMALHVSGPLLEWLERAGHRFLELVGRLSAEGRLEMLLAGFYEPVLPVLPQADRIEQIGWMHAWLKERLGVEARGLWLTERVWEPGLASDLVEAGVEYVLVDDRHFLVAGHESHRLDRPWRTRSGGRGLSVLPIDEHLRYLVPFRSPREIGAYLRSRAAAGHRMAVLADDGEKFGGWPGTAEWVWERGWLESFLDEMERLAAAGVVRLSTPSEVLAEVAPAGLGYLPSASYHEMEEWSLPPAAAEVLARAREALRNEPGSAAVLRGGHWRNFLARYEESNRMHEKAVALSELCRAAGDPEQARRAIGRAQCNDAYWHGVFGGLYLRHLRAAIWSNLAEAERVLRAGDRLDADWVDVDGDGSAEVRIHSAAFSAAVDPAQGGRLVELVDFATGENLADVLTRRREAYHRVETGLDPAAEHAGDHDAIDGDEAMPSIHELEGRIRMAALPPTDLDVRAILVDRVLPTGVSAGAYACADYTPLHSWADDSLEVDLQRTDAAVTVSMRSAGVHRLEKRLRFSEEGEVEVEYAWDPGAFPRDAVFAPELSLARQRRLELDPEPLNVWCHDIVTVSKNESGYEETVQGVSLTPLWPCAAGRARIVIPAGGATVG